MVECSLHQLKKEAAYSTFLLFQNFQNKNEAAVYFKKAADGGYSDAENQYNRIMMELNQSTKMK